MEMEKARYLEIIKRRIRGELKGYGLKHVEITKKGVIIRIPITEIPIFTYGVEVGGEGEGKDFSSQPGDEPGEHEFVELSFEEYINLLLSVWPIKLREKEKLPREDWQSRSVVRRIKHPIVHLRKTLLQAIKRKMLENPESDWENFTFIKDDFWFRSPKKREKLRSQAVVFFLRDVSGSITEELLKAQALVFKTIELLAKRDFKEVEVIRIVHDIQAQILDEESFYKITSSGGTEMKNAIELMSNLINEEYKNYDIFVFQMSDGEDFSNDAKLCEEILRPLFEEEVFNLFSYIQFESNAPQPYGEMFQRLASDYYPQALFNEVSDFNELLENFPKIFGTEGKDEK